MQTEKKADNSLSTMTEFLFDSTNQVVRTCFINEEPYFCAKDVCDILYVKNSRKALVELDDDEKGVSLLVTPSGKQNMSVVNESGLYHLIFRSRKPQAKSFRKWVTSEVIPSIRRHGIYINPVHEELKLMQDRVRQAVHICGSYNKFGSMFGINKAHVTNIINHPDILSQEMRVKVNRAAEHVIQHGIGVDTQTVDLLLKVEDTSVRIALWDKLKTGGVS